MQAAGTDPPPVEVLRAFGAEGTPEALGGFTGAWRVGDHVLKRSHAGSAAVECEARVLAAVVDTGFRLQRLLRARDGSLVVEGWTARAYLEGRHEPGRWQDTLRVGDALSAALGGVGRAEAAPMVEGRTDPWGIADRLAWEEEPLPAGSAFQDDSLRRLAAARRPVRTRSQLVHGDLTGNVLFVGDAPPAVIDFSPYFRPPAYALGVVIADAVVWQGASLDLLAGVDDRPEMGQCLIRALLFRHITELLLARRVPFGPAAGRYAALVEAGIALS
ncbi:MAG: phosphotransferase [Chloroflexi bacterium]|nr:phosphotransferase [Chloroflexota bacterium]